MVTGFHAFNGPSYSDVLVAICTEPLPDIRERAPWLPEAIGEWFGRACARDLGERFQSADEMVEALREAAGPHSRLGRATLPEDVSGPSGTIMGHAPPHVMNTVQASPVDIDLSRPASDDTLRSRTSGVKVPDVRRDSGPPVVTVRPRRSTVGYALLALAGATFALVLVGGSLALRWAYRFLTSSDVPPAPSVIITPATVTTRVERSAPEPQPPPADPKPTVPPPESETKAASKAPSEEVSRVRPRRTTAPPPQPAPGNSTATSFPAPESSERAPQRPARPPPPDMGF
jgi:serine/threonine-protein kinase